MEDQVLDDLPLEREWFQPVTWDELDEDGLLSGLRAVPIHQVGWGHLAQIVKITSAAADIGSQVE